MRLVLDTAVMVAAIRSAAGASRVLLQTALERRGITLLVSVPLLIEYEAVMTRAEHLKTLRLSTGDVADVFDAVAAVAEPVTLAFHWRPGLPDADDDMVLETAANGRADALVTFNRRDFSSVAAQFGIPVLSPGEAVKRWRMKS